MTPHKSMKRAVVKKLQKLMRAMGAAGSVGYVTSSVSSTPIGVRPNDKKPQLGNSRCHEKSVDKNLVKLQC